MATAPAPLPFGLPTQDSVPQPSFFAYGRKVTPSFPPRPPRVPRAKHVAPEKDEAAPPLASTWLHPCSRAGSSTNPSTARGALVTCPRAASSPQNFFFIFSAPDAAARRQSFGPNFECAGGRVGLMRDPSGFALPDWPRKYEYDRQDRWGKCIASRNVSYSTGPVNPPHHSLSPSVLHVLFGTVAPLRQCPTCIRAMSRFRVPPAQPVETQTQGVLNLFCLGFKISTAHFVRCFRLDEPLLFR